MIEVTSTDGRDHRKVFLAPAAIAQVTEAGTSSQWHGIRAYIKTFDGRTIEVTETASQIAALLNSLKAPHEHRTTAGPA